MDAPVPAAFLADLETLPDSRSPHRRQHKLVDLVVIALCGVLSGADSWVEIAAWGRVKKPWLRTFLDLPAGIASHDTFSRVFRLLDPVALETVLLEWGARHPAAHDRRERDCRRWQNPAPQP